jgi:TRAP transporter 4TM/12TM fusion protein
MNTQAAEPAGLMQRLARTAQIGTGIAMVAYHLAAAKVILLGTVQNQNLHLAFVFTLIFLEAIARSDGPLKQLFGAVMLAAGWAVTAYVGFNLEHIQELYGFPEQQDVIIGTVIVLVALAGTFLAWGATLPIVAGLFAAYFFLGHLIPGPLYHKPFSYDYVINYLSIGLSGVYGNFLALSANQIFLFVVFGALLGLMNVTDALNEIGKLAGRKLAGGPGQTAVVSSSLVGMVSGASVANVAITGAFTIPYMKRAGYSGALAGGIEATASTGGQLMPPVMGAAAFLMAFFVGVPYAEIMLAGILPALFFYFAVMLSVQYVSIAEGIRPPDEKPDMRIIARGLPLFAVPLTVITVLLLQKFSPNVAAFWAILSALALSFLRDGAKPSLREIAGALAGGATVGAKIGVSLCVVGLISQTLITTGLGAKIAGLVEVISAGNMLVALFLTMIVAIILGCGVPPVAAYSLVAIVVVPVLIKTGVPPISAHFFCFYFAIISAVTPPVALGALAASAISGAGYFATSRKAFTLSIAGFILPYLIVFNPVMNLQADSWLTACLSVAAIAIALHCLTVLIYGVQKRRLTGGEKALAAGASAAMFAYATAGHAGGWLEGALMFGTGAGFYIALNALQHSRTEAAVQQV